MRIAIFGLGGAGGYFGARLAQAGEEMVFIARGSHLAAVRQDGLRLETPVDDIVVRPALATDDPAEAGPVEAIIVAVKTWQLAEAARAMGPLIGPETFVVPLQNGVEAADELAAVLGRERLVGGLCGTLSWLEGPGHIRSVGGTNFVKFGELDNRPSARTERLRRAFERAGVAVEVPDNIRRAIWEKFLFVVSVGGVGAVTRAPIGVTRSLPETRQMLVGCLAEICALGRALGVPLADSAPADGLAFVDTLAPTGTASLQRDIAEGRPSELEAWNGAVVRLGREAGVATPTHAFIYHSLLPLEERARGRLVF